MNVKTFEKFSKNFLCITEKTFAIQFPITFKFVPTETTTPASITTTPAPSEKQIQCQPGQHQITAFSCNKCPVGNDCMDPNNPVLCKGTGSADRCTVYHITYLIYPP